MSYIISYLEVQYVTAFFCSRLLHQIPEPPIYSCFLSISTDRTWMQLEHLMVIDAKEDFPRLD